MIEQPSWILLSLAAGFLLVGIVSLYLRRQIAILRAVLREGARAYDSLFHRAEMLENSLHGANAELKQAKASERDLRSTLTSYSVRAFEAEAAVGFKESR